MATDELGTAVFTSRAEAQAAADAAMPRRKHNRPYPVSSGWHWARSVPCPACGATADQDCTLGRLHDAREHAARAAGRSADRWIVLVGNVVLMRDGTMYDHQRQVTVRA